MKFEVPVSTILANLLMVQSWIPDRSVYFAINAPAWFVSGLMLRYILFLPATDIFHRRPKLFNIIVAALAIGYFACALTVPDKLVNSLVYIFPPMQLIIFALGMIGYRLLKNDVVKPLSPRALNLSLVATAVLLLLMMVAYPFVTSRLTISSYWWLPTLLLLLLLTKSDNAPGFVTRTLHHPFFLLLGNISYALYILHIPFILSFRIGLRHLGLEFRPIVSFLICSILLILFCYLIHHYISRPLTRLIDRQISGRTQSE